MNQYILHQGFKKTLNIGLKNGFKVHIDHKCEDCHQKPTNKSNIKDVMGSHGSINERPMERILYDRKFTRHI